MSEADDLADFLAKRYDAAEARISAMRHDVADSEIFSCPATRAAPLGDLPYGEENCNCGLAERKSRALRDITLKRAILAGHGPDEHDPELCRTCHVAERGWAIPVPAPRPCATVRHLGTEFTEHAGYQAGWAP